MDRYLRPLAHVASHLRSALAEEVSPPIWQAEPRSYDALISALAALPPIGTVVRPADSGEGLAESDLGAAVMAALRALRSNGDDELVRHSLTLHALLTALQGMLREGGERERDARAILKAACREAHEHEQVEEWMIMQVLSSDEKGLSTK